MNINSGIPTKKNDPETIMIILQCISSQFAIHHVYSYQDDNIEIKKLSTLTKLNIDADHITTISTIIPINTHYANAIRNS